MYKHTEIECALTRKMKLFSSLFRALIRVDSRTKRAPHLFFSLSFTMYNRSSALIPVFRRYLASTVSLISLIRYRVSDFLLIRKEVPGVRTEAQNQYFWHRQNRRTIVTPTSGAFPPLKAVFDACDALDFPRINE